jgi:beta,beta-carotene 9',10'-dioxygenase
MYEVGVRRGACNSLDWTVCSGPILVAEATHRKGLESQLQEVALDELEVSGSIPSWLCGRDYRYAYATSLRDPGVPGFLDQLAKLDVAEGSLGTWHEEGCFPGEPVFVAAPDGDGEDEGVLLSVVLDARRGTSFLLALDAADLHEVGRAHVPQHIPFGFHGAYFRSA